MAGFEGFWYNIYYTVENVENRLRFDKVTEIVWPCCIIYLPVTAGKDHATRQHMHSCGISEHSV